jgi:hypothetical protein
MTFGRMNNMRRRTYRPNESHHRSLRRKSVDRSAMLNTEPVRPSLLERMVRAVMKLIAPRQEK